MGDLNRIYGDELRAMKGELLLAVVHGKDDDCLQVLRYFYVREYRDHSAALNDWRELNRKRAPKTYFMLFDSEGHVVDGLGTQLEEYELRARPGEFLVVTMDPSPRMQGFSFNVYWRRFSTKNRAEAERFADLDDQHGYTSNHVFDEHGTALPSLQQAA